MKYWLTILMIAMSLMGCASTKTETVTVVKNIYVEVPNELVERCTATVPPDIVEYSKLSPTSKEYTLTMYAANLLQDIAACSQQIVKIQQWSSQQHCCCKYNSYWNKRCSCCKYADSYNSRRYSTSNYTYSI